MTPREVVFNDDSDSDDDSSCVRIRSLGIVLDLDGTLIIEEDEFDDETDCGEDGNGDGDDSVSASSSADDEAAATSTRSGAPFIRPGAVEFLQWCHARGHSTAVWTAAHPSWANFVTYKLCSEASPHRCDGGPACRRLFDFVWSRDKLRERTRIPTSAHHGNGREGACCWCDAYSRHCLRCDCSRAVFQCPCRYTKDLNKVWRSGSEETARYTKERTILIENTPQQCTKNFGNAVYVPTYDGTQPAYKERHLFQRLKQLVLKLEASPDVRTVGKCNHRVQGGGSGAHACFEQSWWGRRSNSSSVGGGGAGGVGYCVPIEQPQPQQRREQHQQLAQSQPVAKHKLLHAMDSNKLTLTQLAGAAGRQRKTGALQHQHQQPSQGASLMHVITRHS